MTKKLLLAAGCCALLFAACKKDDDKTTNPSTNPTKKDLLVAGKWQIKAMTMAGVFMGTPVNEDLYADMDDCDKDNYLVFNANGTVEFNVGATKCDTDDSTYSGTYSLINNDSKIVLNEQGGSDTMDIFSLTATQLKVGGTEKIGTDSVVTTITLNNIK